MSRWRPRSTAWAETRADTRPGSFWEAAWWGPRFPNEASVLGREPRSGVCIELVGTSGSLLLRAPLCCGREGLQLQEGGGSP